MSDRQKTDPLDAWRALEDLRADVAMDKVLATDLEARREALRNQGVDPDEARRVGEDTVREAARRAGGGGAKPPPCWGAKVFSPVWIAVALVATVVGLFAWKHGEVAAWWKQGSPQQAPP
jgi:hypothetical protein